MTAVWFLRRWWRHLCDPPHRPQGGDDMQNYNGKGWDW